MRKTKYILAIDLHGTLLNRNWEIDKINDLVFYLKKVRQFCKIYICTGNNFSFVKKHIPDEILDKIDGFVLETGCIILEKSIQRTLTSKNEIKIIKNVEKYLKKNLVYNIKYFAERISTISIFTDDGREGCPPEELFAKIKQILEKSEFKNTIKTTHSNVAVDIIPVNYNKYTGIRSISENLKIISIADSLNDSELLLNSDISFIPKNSSPSLLNYLKKKTMIQPLSKTLNFGNIYISNYKYTLAVIEILKNIELLNI